MTALILEEQYILDRPHGDKLLSLIKGANFKITSNNILIMPTNVRFSGDDVIQAFNVYLNFLQHDTDYIFINITTS